MRSFLSSATRRLVSCCSEVSYVLSTSELGWIHLTLSFGFGFSSTGWGWTGVCICGWTCGCALKGATWGCTGGTLCATATFGSSNTGFCWMSSWLSSGTALKSSSNCSLIGSWLTGSSIGWTGSSWWCCPLSVTNLAGLNEPFSLMEKLLAPLSCWINVGEAITALLFGKPMISLS